MARKYLSVEERICKKLHIPEQNFLSDTIAAFYGGFVTPLRFPTYLRKRQEGTILIERREDGGAKFFEDIRMSVRGLVGTLTSLTIGGILSLNTATNGINHGPLEITGINYEPLVTFLGANIASAFYESARTIYARRNTKESITN